MCAHAKNFDYALDIAALMAQCNVKGNEHTFSTLISCAEAAGKPEEAMSLLNMYVISICYIHGLFILQGFLSFSFILSCDVGR